VWVKVPALQHPTLHIDEGFFETRQSLGNSSIISNASRFPPSKRFPCIATGRLAPVRVVEPDDVVLFEVWAGLHFHKV
jgi:hypothetical protein